MASKVAQQIRGLNYDGHLSEFEVIYDGNALKQHTMDVRDLVPALLSLGQAFDRANSLLNGNNVTINLQIKAQTAGSFDIALLLSQTLQNASGTLDADWLKTADSLKDLLIGGAVGVVSLLLLIKQLRGKIPKQRESKESPGCITFEAENIKIIVPVEVARLYNDKPIRDQVEGVVRPLLKAGIDKVTFKQNKKELATINSSEVDYFTLSDDNDETKDILLQKQRLQMRTTRFFKGKWELNDGANTHYYSMDDQQFLSEIDKGKAIGKWHILICDVLMRQRVQSDGKLKSEFSVIKVINHIIPGEQLPLKK